MQIRSTLTRLTAEEAAALAGKDNDGLIGNFFNKLTKNTDHTQVLWTKKFYYPYYIGGAVLTHTRAAKLPERNEVMVAVMEGGFGTVQDMKGRPTTETLEPPAEQIAVCPYDTKEAKLKIAQHMAKKAYKKFRSVPEVDFKELYVIYKPHYVCYCRRGKKEYYRVVDAELKERNYMLDIRYPKLQFMDRAMKENRIDRKLLAEQPHYLDAIMKEKYGA